MEGGANGNSPVDLIDRGENPEAACLRGELRKLVAKAMETLSPRLRAVLALRDLEELSTEETARLLGISEAAVKTRLLRARMRMRGRLAPVLGGPQGWIRPTIQ